MRGVELRAYTPLPMRPAHVSIADGDTLLTVLDSARLQHKVRRYTQTCVRYFNWTATLDCYKVDRFKRQVCRVRVDRQDVGLAQVQARTCTALQEIPGGANARGTDGVLTRRKRCPLVSAGVKDG